jgi:hypothetical protein
MTTSQAQCETNYPPPTPASDANRCLFITSDGRQCRLTRSPHHSTASERVYSVSTVQSTTPSPQPPPQKEQSSTPLSIETDAQSSRPTQQKPASEPLCTLASGA